MKKSFYFLFLLMFIFPLSFSFAQENGGAQTSTEWQRVQSDNGEFSVEMPANFTYFYDKDGFLFDPNNSLLHFAEMRMLNAAQSKTVMSVEIYKVNSPRKHLEFLLEMQRMEATKIKDAPENFTVKQIERTSIQRNLPGGEKKNVEISYAVRFIASKTHLYVVTVANRGAVKTPEFDKFLASVRLKENQTGNVVISSLKPLTINNVAADVDADPNAPVPPLPNQSKTPVAPSPDSILIVHKPFPGYTNPARERATSGTIRLRLTFNKNGGVSKIGLISGLENGLNRNAFFAALRIKFIPEEKDGVPVTVTKVVEYNFSIR